MFRIHKLNRDKFKNFTFYNVDAINIIFDCNLFSNVGKDQLLLVVETFYIAT